MIPGMNPRQMRQAMKRLGIQQEEIDAKEVIIRLEGKEIVISNPSVSKVNMMGQDTYQIVGEESERSLDTKPEISDEDIDTVAEQSGASKEEAKQAIEEANGDLAEAIMKLKKD
ncbi:nascent polypeptide-associated complex protein [Candidatus Woesearchaeota archaeon]|nr:nascent polypeptide-associated complex protein [Candidatus Woesearchaeota archaeon]